MYKYIVVIAILLLTLSACRVRLVDVILEPETEPEHYTVAEVAPLSESAETMPEDELPQEPEITPEAEDVTEDIIEEIYEPEITETATEFVFLATEEVAYGGTAEAGETPVLTEEPGEILIDTPTDIPGDTTLDDTGDGTLGLILDRTTGLLGSGVGSLFECQRLYVYFEHLHDFRTVNRNSPQNDLITNAGGFNAAARRSNDSLVVDAEWLMRQNPQVFVRTVTSDILGRNVSSTARAEALRNEILTRSEIENVNAILHRQVLLISEELLTTDEGRMIATLHIARAMYPELFASVNMTELYNEILHAGGADFTVGTFALWR